MINEEIKPFDSPERSPSFRIVKPQHMGAHLDHQSSYSVTGSRGVDRVANLKASLSKSSKSFFPLIV
jgi:hypothetical protein